MSRLAELKALACKPTVTWEDDLERHIKGVCEAMTNIHGGKWNAMINHEVCLVTIVRVMEGWNPELPA